MMNLSFLDLFILGSTVARNEIDVWYFWAFWGALGSIAYDFLAYVNSSRNPDIGFYQVNRDIIIGILLRLVGASIVTTAFGTSGQLTSALGALTIGITAPVIVSQLYSAAEKNSSNEEDNKK